MYISLSADIYTTLYILKYFDIDVSPMRTYILLHRCVIIKFYMFFKARRMLTSNDQMNALFTNRIYA